MNFGKPLTGKEADVLNKTFKRLSTMTPETIAKIEAEAEIALRNFEYRGSLEEFAKRAYIVGRTAAESRIKELEDGLHFIENNYGNYDEVRIKIHELLNK